MSQNIKSVVETGTKIANISVEKIKDLFASIQLRSLASGKVDFVGKEITSTSRFIMTSLQNDSTDLLNALNSIIKLNIRIPILVRDNWGKIPVKYRKLFKIIIIGFVIYNINKLCSLLLLSNLILYKHNPSRFDTNDLINWSLLVTGYNNVQLIQRNRFLKIIYTMSIIFLYHRIKTKQKQSTVV